MSSKNKDVIDRRLMFHESIAVRLEARDEYQAKQNQNHIEKYGPSERVYNGQSLLMSKMPFEMEESTRKPQNCVVRQFERFRKRLEDFITDQRVQLLIVGLIVVNSAFMGILTFEKVSNDEKAVEIISYIDVTILIIFSIELCINLIVHNKKFFSNRWLAFDFVTVTSSLAFPDAKIIRTFRIFRAFRLFGRLESLKKILYMLFSTSDLMVSIFFVLMLVTYIFAVLLTQLFQDCQELHECYGDDDIDYFGSLGMSFISLFQLMVLEDWANLTRMIQVKHVWAWLPITIFIIISSFIFLNLIIAVLCDSLNNLPKNEEIVEDVDTSDASTRFLERLSEKDIKRRKTVGHLAIRLSDMRKKLIKVRENKRIHRLGQRKKTISGAREITPLTLCSSYAITTTSLQSSLTFTSIMDEVPDWSSVENFPVASSFFRDVLD